MVMAVTPETVTEKIQFQWLLYMFDYKAEWKCDKQLLEKDHVLIIIIIRV